MAGNGILRRDVDRGYAWFILLGCFLMYLLTVGSVKAYGVLYTEFLGFYGTGSGNTAWVGSISLLFMLGLGPFSNALCQRFSFRLITFFGGILLGVGYVSTAFVPKMELMNLTFGVITGQFNMKHFSFL
ncbi:hypothetical protein CHS0354_006334 [Potamilus streckersoni]|uniref:Major facilitator superfamily (MFS) profile domain-containing protein n=1 Tax=Potamilus streckersoni TaxID=2493646 RepID=A0AAE0S374_9BIVA|nr:hypothetical protein CHS0354_006334 [Potamilus streckersoni]